MRRWPFVLPSHSDDVVAASSNVIGGPVGRYADITRRYWNPLRVLVLLATGGYLLGYLLDFSCVREGWRDPERYEHLCYSDIPALFGFRGFVDGYLPYLQTPPGGQPLEYPVLSGVFMQISAMFSRTIEEPLNFESPSNAFFTANVILLLIPLIVLVLATALVVKRRPWDAAMVALAPVLILTATINWDLLAAALAALALVFWSRNRAFGAGIWLGLAIAAKFYPLVFLGAFLVLAIRTGKWPAFGRLMGGTVGAWLAVNIPFAVANTEGWFHFYSFSSERGIDFGSLWYALPQLGFLGVPDDRANIAIMISLIALCGVVAVIGLSAPRRPRLAQLLFLVLAAFVLTNKVYSPQYVIWLLPLAVLARPKWRDLIIWQIGQVVYFMAIWWHLIDYVTEEARFLNVEAYSGAVLIHAGATVYLCIMVIRDIYRPEHDPVRNDGFTEDLDDPGGGPFDGAPDVWTLRREEEQETIRR